MLFSAPTAMMVITSPRLSGFVLLAIPVIVIPLVAFGRWVGAAVAHAQIRWRTDVYASELLGAIRTVQLYQRANWPMAFGAMSKQAYEAARSHPGARGADLHHHLHRVLQRGRDPVGRIAHVLTGSIQSRPARPSCCTRRSATGLGQLQRGLGEVSAASGLPSGCSRFCGSNRITAPPSPIALPAPPPGMSGSMMQLRYRRGRMCWRSTAFRCR